MSRTRTHLLAASLAIVAAVLGALLARGLLAPTSPEATSLTGATLLAPPRPIPEFTLRDDADRPVDRQYFEGHWHLVFFGFTSCPDVCPTTLTVLAAVERKLADLPDGQRPGVVLVSVDPERDRPSTLHSYVQFFSPHFAGLTGAVSAIDALAQAFGVPVARVPVAGGGYTVDHGAAIFLLDPAARIRALFSTPHDAEVIAADYRRILGMS
jgi:protein SCO1